MALGVGCARTLPQRDGTLATCRPVASTIHGRFKTIRSSDCCGANSTPAATAIEGATGCRRQTRLQTRLQTTICLRYLRALVPMPWSSRAAVGAGVIGKKTPGLWVKRGGPSPTFHHRA